MPDDGAASSLPDTVESFIEENHHAGEGLFTLTELIRLAEGGLWIWSGDCQLTDIKGNATCKAGSPRWDGLAIEIGLDVDKAQLINSSRVKESKLEEIAARLGL
jgi:hypothetical protein